MMELESVEATDFCVFESMRVDLSRQGLVFICADNRDSDGALSNGAGKTTIFKAVTWCLFEECVDGDKGDEIIRRGTKKATTLVTISDGSTRWYITRSRTKGKPRVKMEREDASEPGVRHPIDEGREEINARIIDLIGLDFHAFKNTVLYGANDIVKFADPRTKDSDRKEMLHCILRTSIFKTAHRKALDRAKEVRDDIAKVDRRIERVDAAIEDVDLPTLKTRRDGWQAKHDEKIQESLREAKESREEAERLRAIDFKADIKGIREKIEGLKATHAEAKKLSEDLETLDADLEDRRSKYGAMQKLETQCETRIESIDEALAKLGGDKCPLCSSPMDEGHAAFHVEGLRSQRRDFKDELKGLRLSMEAYAEESKTVAKKRKVAMQKVREMEDINTIIRDQEKRLREKEREQEQAKRDIEEAVKATRECIAHVKELRAEVNPHKAAYDEGRAKVKELSEKLKELQDERGEHELLLAHVQFWVKGYSNQGLPSFVLDSVMPIITDRANHYLETLADGDITMDFQTQRELKSTKGEVRDQITIVMNIEGNEGVTPSSGQRTKMNLATDLALMDLVSKREHAHLNLLMLDEVLDGLDAEGTERVLLLIQELRAKRGSVFVISHGSAMAEIFEHGLRVVKEDKKAIVERMS